MIVASRGSTRSPARGSSRSSTAKTGVSSSSRPASTSFSIVTAVRLLETLASANSVRGVTGSPVRTSARPYPFASTSAPFLAIANDAPGVSNFVMTWTTARSIGSRPDPVSPRNGIARTGGCPAAGLVPNPMAATISAARPNCFKHPFNHSLSDSLDARSVSSVLDKPD